MQDLKYNIINKIVNRKMVRLNQIEERVKIKTYSIGELMELSEEIEYLSSTLMPYFKIK